MYLNETMGTSPFPCALVAWLSVTFAVSLNAEALLEKALDCKLFHVILFLLDTFPPSQV